MSTEKRPLVILPHPSISPGVPVQTARVMVAEDIEAIASALEGGADPEHAAAVLRSLAAEIRP